MEFKIGCIYEAHLAGPCTLIDNPACLLGCPGGTQATGEARFTFDKGDGICYYGRVAGSRGKRGWRGSLILRDSKIELVNIDQEKQGTMNPNRKTARILEDVKISVKIKLSALWVGLMLFYLYNDVFTFFRKKFIEEVLAGEVQITQVFMLGAVILMAIPILMVFLSLVLPARVNRWTNIIVGIFLAVVLLTTLLVPGVLMAYYALCMILEVVFIALIVWHAWKWPKQEA